MIKHKLGRIRQFSVNQLNQELPFETRYIVRMLVKKGFLEQVSLAPKKLVYKRVKDVWPPPAGFYSVGRIGLPYYVEQWFRRFLGAALGDRSQAFINLAG